MLTFWNPLVIVIFVVVVSLSVSGGKPLLLVGDQITNYTIFNL